MKSQTKALLGYQALSYTDPSLHTVHTSGLKHIPKENQHNHRHRNNIEANGVAVLQIHHHPAVVPFCNVDVEHDVPHKALFHLIDYIFDNILSRLSEDCKNGVMIELWKLVPYEVLLDLDASANNRWSKQGIFEAYKVAEQTSEEFCLHALSKLLNFNEEPIITNVAIQFIEQHYPDVVYISTANVKNVNPRTSGFSKTHTKHLLQRGLTRKLEKEVAYSPKESKSLNKNKRFILFVLAGIAVTSLTCYIASILYFSKTNEQTNQILRLLLITDGTTQGSTELRTVPSSSPSTDKPVTESRYYITVSSYKSYKNALFKLMHDREISLEVSFENDEGWPLDFAVGDTHIITELKMRCGVSIYKVFNLLGSMQNAQNITISNINACECQTLPVENMPDQGKIVLMNVHQLKLESLGNCPKFLKELTQKFVFSGLHTFQVYNSALEKHDGEQIKKLISNSRYYLKSIELSRCILNAPLFENNVGTYKNVEFLHVDFLGNDVIGQINKHISNVFPNLRTFVSSYGFVNWNTLLNFSGCLSLEYIKVGLRISPDSNSLSLIPFLQAFQKLKVLHLSLNFVGRNRALGCKVVGLEEVEASLNNFTYRSNCLVESDIK